MGSQLLKAGKPSCVKCIAKYFLLLNGDHILKYIPSSYSQVTCNVTNYTTGTCAYSFRCQLSGG